MDERGGTSRCRVLHVCGRMKDGGITRLVESILDLNGTSESRHDLMVTFATGPEPEGRGYTVHRLDFGRRGALACMKAAREIFRHYDAVMVHGAHPVAALPLLGLRTRTFLFQHGMAVSSGPRWKRAAKRAWFSVLPRVLRARIVCSTEFAYRKSRELGIRLRRDQVSIVPFGTGIQRVLRSDEQGVGEVIHVGMAGRLDRQKRQDLVLESLGGYAGRHRIRVVVAGDGSERERLEELARSVRSECVDIEFLGLVEDMAAFYDGLDLLAFPSRGESFGLVVLEALTRSVPVAVFSDVGGCLPLVQAGRTGFVLEDGKEGMAALWRELDERPNLLLERCRTIAGLDLSRFGVAGTRAELDRLAGCCQRHPVREGPVRESPGETPPPPADSPA